MSFLKCSPRSSMYFSMVHPKCSVLYCAHMICLLLWSYTMIYIVTLYEIVFQLTFIVDLNLNVCIWKVYLFLISNANFKTSILRCPEICIAVVNIFSCLFYDLWCIASQAELELRPSCLLYHLGLKTHEHMLPFLAFLPLLFLFVYYCLQQ